MRHTFERLCAVAAQALEAEVEGPEQNRVTIADNHFGHAECRIVHLGEHVAEYMLDPVDAAHMIKRIPKARIVAIERIESIDILGTQMFVKGHKRIDCGSSFFVAEMRHDQCLSDDSAVFGRCPRNTESRSSGGTRRATRRRYQPIGNRRSSFMKRVNRLGK